ncbi:MAG: phosphatase PAP2 family protein [Ignavibacteriaceae bacterium]|nr:phosphatase PAP2 family protein [Ignavibacteriaceae bacterium]
MRKETKLNPLYFSDYENDRQKKYYALILLISSLIIFLISALGLFDWLSELTSSFLESKLGFTNKWSKSIGPEWFVGLNKDVAALGGFPVLFIFLTIIIIYYNLRKESRRLWRLLFIITGGCILMLIAKTFFAHEIPDDPIEIVTNSISSFPSGHAMMGTIFYTTLAVTISRRQHSHKTKRFTLISGVVIVFLIGISRILPANHSVADVVAGWSLGAIWLCLCWILERRIKKQLKKESAVVSLSFNK